MSLRDKRYFIIDLDGTLYRGNEPIEHAAAFIQFLYNKERPFLLATNCPERTPELVVDKLRNMGIEVKPENVLTSGQAAASYLKEQSESPEAYVIGSPEYRVYLEEAGIKITDESPGFVLVGFDRSFDYAAMKKAAGLILEGARFICTNSDSTIPDGSSIIPHTGALAASIQAATGQSPVFTGKPEEFMMKVCLEYLGCSRDHCCIIGDRLDTDIKFGRDCGVETVLVLTGVTGEKELELSKIKPDHVFRHLGELKEALT